MVIGTGCVVCRVSDTRIIPDHEILRIAIAQRGLAPRGKAEDSKKHNSYEYY